MSFREYLLAKHGTVRGSVIDPRNQHVFVPTAKRPGDKILGAGYQWSVVS